MNEFWFIVSAGRMGWISFDLYCQPGGRSELVLVYCVSWADEVNEFWFIVSAERTRRMSFSSLRRPGLQLQSFSTNCSFC